MKKLAVLLLLLGSVIGCTKQSPTPPAALEKVRVQAGWVLNGEFANICSAIVEGMYARKGLEVELVPGGPVGGGFVVATNAIAQDASLDIAVDGDVVPLLRGITKTNEAEQLRVKAFAAFWNDNPFGFIVREDSGITSIKDLAIKRKPDGSKYRIGLTADAVVQYAIAQYAGVDVSSLNLVTTGFDATPFLLGQVDALGGYWTTQAFEAEKAGIPYHFLPASELPGFNQPSMVAIATDATLHDRRKMLIAWLEATIEGSRFVIDNPRKAAEQIRDPRCGGPSFDVAQEEWLIRKSIPLFDRTHPGILSAEQLDAFARGYHALQQIPRHPALEEWTDFSILRDAN